MLAKNKVAKANWEKMAFTHKKEMAVWIEGAKQEKTRDAAVGESGAGVGEGDEVDGLRID